MAQPLRAQVYQASSLHQRRAGRQTLPCRFERSENNRRGKPQVARREDCASGLPCRQLATARVASSGWIPPQACAIISTLFVVSKVTFRQYLANIKNRPRSTGQG